MGQPLTIHNKTPENIFVEWKTVGGVFTVASYNINAWSSQQHTEEAVWYDIYIIHNGNKFVATFYGGSSASWTFDGKNIINNIGNVSRSETGDFADTKSPAESGVVSVPLNHPVVRSIVSYFQNLEVSQ